MAVSSSQHLDLEQLNALMESRDPSSVIQWAGAHFGRDLVMTSSFGEQAAVLIHLAGQVMPDIRVIFIDTGYLFPETHQFMEQLRRRLNLNIWTYRTRNDPFGYLRHAREKDPAGRNDISACCAANKNEPTERAFSEMQPKAWLRGIRREQAQIRKNAAHIEWSPRYNCYAVSPLLNWTRRDVGVYLKRHDLPWHPLVEKGYLSIGCNPLACTRPVRPGEDPRSGRWAGTGRLECGINSLDSAKL